MEKLGIALGVEDYLEAIKKYYVDKTLLIRDVLNSVSGGGVMITRPRRFGKSLMLSMLDYFFNMNGDYRYAFDDKKIASCKDLYSKYINQFPVIHLSLKDVYGDNDAEIIESLKDAISQLYLQHSFLLQSEALLEVQKQECAAIMNKKADAVLWHNSLKRISDFLFTHYQRKVVFLVDEYDAPLARANEIGCYEQVMSFLKPIFSAAFKGNKNVFLTIITGVLQISKESLFSGLNNLIDSSVGDVFLNEYFGFTTSEVQDLLSYYGINESIDNLSSWYGGYNRANGQELFNPWSIMNFALNRRFHPYWVNTGSNALLKQTVSQTNLPDFLETLDNQFETSYFVKEVNYGNYSTNKNALLSFLTQTGYLVIKNVHEDGSCRIGFPNKEIGLLFENEVLSAEPNNVLIRTLRDAFISQKEDDIKRAMEDYILSAFSYYDILSEKDYQNILTSLLAAVFQDYAVKSEVNAGDGRCDIMLSPKKPGGIGIVIEVKNSKAKREPSKTNLAKIASMALIQIEAKGYAEPLRQRGCKSIVEYGFAFWKKTVSIQTKVIQF